MDVSYPRSMDIACMRMLLSHGASPMPAIFTDHTGRYVAYRCTHANERQLLQREL